MHFFHLKYLNAQGILAPKFYNSHTIFLQFLMLKMGDDLNNQASSVS